MSKISCPKCRTTLIQPSGDQELDEALYCPKCGVSYDSPIRLKGVPVSEIKCIDETNNVFQAKAGNYTFVVKQPRIADHASIVEALKLASEYTFLRYPSLVWEHSEGMCYLPLYVRGYLGKLYLIMILDGRVVGFSHHSYWLLNEAIQKKEEFPVPVGSTMALVQLAVLDPYQRQGVGSLYAKVSEYITSYNEADFIMGETFKEGGMLNIRLRDGWKAYEERRVEDGTIRILIGKPLT